LLLGDDCQAHRGVKHQIESLLERRSLLGHATSSLAKRLVGNRVVALHTIPTQHRVAVGQLARVLDEKAGLADELAWLLRQHFERAVVAVVAVWPVVVVIVIVVGDDEALLQDYVEARFHVVRIGLLLVVIVVFVFVPNRCRRLVECLLALFELVVEDLVIERVLVESVLIQGVLIQGVLIEPVMVEVLFGQLFEVLLVGVVRNIRLVFQKIVVEIVVSHAFAPFTMSLEPA
jgi:hypothetical protein